jgi:hypothetical protein
VFIRRIEHTPIGKLQKVLERQGFSSHPGFPAFAELKQAAHSAHRKGDIKGYQDLTIKAIGCGLRIMLPAEEVTREAVLAVFIVLED